MIHIKPQDFCSKWGFTFDPQKHHSTGPARYHQPEGNGAVWYEEGRILANFAVQLGGHVLETGTNLAISTRFISEGLDKNGGQGKVYTIDIDQWWAPHPDWPRIIPFCMDSKYFPTRRFAWAFVDGDHYYDGVAGDIALVKRCGIPLVVFHDSAEPNQRKPGRSFPVGGGADVVQAVTDHMDEAEWDLYNVETGCGLIVAALKNCSFYS